jgi:hypothetical protein
VDEPEFSPSEEAFPKARKPKEKRPYRYTTLGPRQHKYLRLRHEQMVRGGNKTDKQLMIDAGFKKTVIAKQANDSIIKLCQGNQEMMKKLDDAGLGMDSIVEDVKKLRNAQTMTVDKDGVEHTRDDNDIQFKTMAWRANVFNAMPTKQININERRLNINISEDTMERIRKLKGDEEFKRLIAEDEI